MQQWIFVECRELCGLVNNQDFLSFLFKLADILTQVCEIIWAKYTLHNLK